MFFSIIVPVYNRPNEVYELLTSLCEQNFIHKFEIIIIEDGSEQDCKKVVKQFENQLDIVYLDKNNSGPGDSRNFGMQNANGDYFLIFDSDCIIPKDYLSIVYDSLKQDFVHCFGGPDNASKYFTDIQKAINFSMTSFLTTGGIRGGSESLNAFQPRSFNMGLSKEIFLKTKGFSNIHPGEDPDLSIRIWKEGYETKLIKDAYVYHKRRIDWKKFFVQVNKFGKARPILDVWHQDYSKKIFAFPSVFILGLLFSLIFIKYPIFMVFYGIYFSMILIFATIKNNLKIGLMSVFAVLIQFFGYGIGYLQSTFCIKILKQNPEIAFPELFFTKNKKV